MDERYSRNIPAITPEAQTKLQNSHVCVAGCGGLGGYLIEFLARAGVGHFTVIDGDSFESSNLNRQCLSTSENIGVAKTSVARQRIADIDSRIAVRAENVFLDAENAKSLLTGADLVMDGLDSSASRLVLMSACQELGIPLIHGAIQGWNAQISVCMPDDPSVLQLYQKDSVSEETSALQHQQKSPDPEEPSALQQEQESPDPEEPSALQEEQNLPAPEEASALQQEQNSPAQEEKSCLSFTPALCAAIQCAEAVKLLTREEPVLKSKLLLADLRYMDFLTLDLCGGML